MIPLVTPEAETGDVRGWLIPARKVLSSQLGVSLDMVVEARVTLELRDWRTGLPTRVPCELFCERFERVDRMDA